MTQLKVEFYCEKQALKIHHIFENVQSVYDWYIVTFGFGVHSSYYLNIFTQCYYSIKWIECRIWFLIP